MTEHHYRLGKHMDAGAIAAALAPLGEVTLQPTSSSECTLLDTFDWRLYHAGLYLEEQQDSEGAFSECRRLEDERRVAACDGQVPRFADQLPPGSLHDALVPLLKMRALLPVVRLKRETRELRLLDAREKTTLRLQIRHEQVLNHLPPKQLPPRLHLIPLRGFEQEAKQARRHIEQALELKPGKKHPLQRALAAIGRQPGDYSSKLHLDLSAEMPAFTAMHTILATLFDTMEQNEQGIIEDLDSEFLHDFRVAVRRARTALTQLKPAMPDVDRWRLQPGFHWLGDITTPVRDLDVWLLKFDARRAVLPETMRDDLQPLRDLIRQERDNAWRSLVRQLQSRDYTRLKRHVGQAMAHLQQDAATTTQPTTRAMADGRIGKMHRRVLKEGGAITKKSPPEALHELRKSCKKLRYLLEFFRSLYPDARVRRQIRQLKKLQDNLGVIQDARVQLQTLAEWRERLQQGGATQATLAAVDWLAEDIRHIGYEARKGFGDSFDAFSAKKNRKQMQEMLKA